jgi:hypothetical protein
MTNQLLIDKALRYQENAHLVIGEMMNDSIGLNDYLIHPSQVMYQPNYLNNGVQVVFSPKDSEYLTLGMSKNAISQFSGKHLIPGGYLSELAWSKDEPWKRNLASIIMNKHAGNQEKKKILIRAVNDEVRGYLSNTYERYSSIEVFKDFIGIAQEHQAVISNAYYNGINSYVEALVIDPVTILGEEWLYGVQFRNSDFGGAALDMRLMLIKLVCTNGMTRNSLLRKIHRSSEIESLGIELSQETLYHNTMAKKSLIKDFSNHIFNRDNILKEANMLETVGRINVEPTEVIKKLPALGATKNDIEEVRALLMANAVHTGVRNGGGVIRVANAVSYLANTVDEADRIADYKDISGKLINLYVEQIKQEEYVEQN